MMDRKNILELIKLQFISYLFPLHAQYRNNIAIDLLMPPFNDLKDFIYDKDKQAG